MRTWLLLLGTGVGKVVGIGVGTSVEGVRIDMMTYPLPNVGATEYDDEVHKEELQ